VLAANADVDVLQRYDEDLDAAFEQAREQGDVTAGPALCRHSLNQYRSARVACAAGRRLMLKVSASRAASPHALP